MFTAPQVQRYFILPGIRTHFAWNTHRTAKPRKRKRRRSDAAEPRWRQTGREQRSDTGARRGAAAAPRRHQARERALEAPGANKATDRLSYVYTLMLAATRGHRLRKEGLAAAPEAALRDRAAVGERDALALEPLALKGSRAIRGQADLAGRVDDPMPRGVRSTRESVGQQVADLASVARHAGERSNLAVSRNLAHRNQLDDVENSGSKGVTTTACGRAAKKSAR
jgi:hypothetical protein